MKERFNSRNYTERTAPIVVKAGENMIPWLRRGENFEMTVASFPDHGKPCFVGSAIKSNPDFLELARELSPDESRASNERFRAEVERILDGGDARRVGTMSSKIGDKPVVHRLLAGESYDPKALMLYYTRGQFDGAPAVYLLAIAKVKDLKKVERVFENAGYERNKSWKANQEKKLH